MSQNNYSVTVPGNLRSLPVVETLGELVAARIGDLACFSVSLIWATSAPSRGNP